MKPTIAIALLFTVGCTPHLPYPKQTAPAQFSSAAAPLNTGVSLTLAWDASPDPSIVGYKVHHGTASRKYTSTTDVGADMTCRLEGFDIGQQYYFAATSYNSAGTESVYSEELVYTIPSKELEIILFGAPSASGPWFPVATNIVSPSEPAGFFIQQIKWH